MQFTTIALASALASLVAAAPSLEQRADLIIDFTTFNNSDTTCGETDRSGSASIPTPGGGVGAGAGSCLTLPPGTSSVQEYVPCYATAANSCVVNFFNNDSCEGEANDSYTAQNCDFKCTPAPPAGYGSILVRCPSS